jgi:hypothetical protein
VCLWQRVGYACDGAGGGGEGQPLPQRCAVCSWLRFFVQMVRVVPQGFLRKWCLRAKAATNRREAGSRPKANPLLLWSGMVVVRGVLAGEVFSANEAKAAIALAGDSGWCKAHLTSISARQVPSPTPHVPSSPSSPCSNHTGCRYRAGKPNGSDVPTKERRPSQNHASRMSRRLPPGDLVRKVGTPAARTQAPQSFVLGRFVPKATDRLEATCWWRSRAPMLVRSQCS